MYQRGRTTAVEEVTLRDSPRDGDTLRKLPRHTEFDILGRETWLRIKLDDGTVGFVLADFVESDSETAEAEPDAPVEIVEYRPEYGSQVFVGEKIRCDRDFEAQVKKIEHYAKEKQILVWVTSSLREPYETVDSNIVDPAKLSNHHVGHAIDFNLIHNGTTYRSTDLQKLSTRSPQESLPVVEDIPQAIIEFIEWIRSAESGPLRWGGDFPTPDPIHIDDELNWRDRERYKKKLVSLWGEGILERFA